MIIALHISIALNLLTLGLIFWFRKKQQQHNEWFYGETEASEHGYRALMEDFTNYQVKCDRELSKLEKELEIKTKQLERSQTKLVKDLPKDIRKVIGHIEFARPLDKI